MNRFLRYNKNFFHSFKIFSPQIPFKNTLIDFPRFNQLLILRICKQNRLFLHVLLRDNLNQSILGNHLIII